jgi:hypothetical protein
MPRSYCLGASDRCAWSDPAAACIAKPCSQLAVCDTNRCTLTSTGQCTTANCSRATTSSECPSASGDCIWVSDLCGSGECSVWTNGVQCNATPGCQWLPDESACVTVAHVAAISCLSFYETGCRTFGSNRCEWMVDSFYAGRCIPKNLSSRPKCFEFTPGGREACPTTHCEWSKTAGVAQCVNPYCAAFTYEVNAPDVCAARGCWWLNERYRCVDQQYDRLPCWTYYAESCPQGRCRRDGDFFHCLAAGVATPAEADANGFPIATLDCGSNTDPRICSATQGCGWVGGSADGYCSAWRCMQYSAATCPAPRCRAAFGRCHDRCSARFPFWCASTNTCARSKWQCRRCATHLVHCAVDSTCATSFEECPCDPPTFQRCPTGTRSCVPDLSLCPSNSSSPGTSSNRSCPERWPVLCADGTCATDETNCNRSCNVSSLAPIKCWNSDCAPTSEACSCPPETPLRCIVDWKCYADATGCPCGYDTSERRCSNGMCVPRTTACENSTVYPCPSATPYRCSDGSCRAEPSSCPCPESSFAVPAIEFSASDDDFDQSMPYPLVAFVNKAVCNNERNDLSVAVRWSVSSPCMASNYTDQGYQLTLPPGRLTDGCQLLITAVASFGLANTQSSCSMILTARWPQPRVRMIGGDWRLTGPIFTVAVDIEDPMRASSDNVYWRCCVGHVKGCLADCPIALRNAISLIRGDVFTMGAAAPVGNYTVFAAYRGVEAQQQITIVEAGRDVLVRYMDDPSEELLSFEVVTPVAPYINFNWTSDGLGMRSASHERLQVASITRDVWSMGVKACASDRPLEEAWNVSCGAAKITGWRTALSVEGSCELVGIAARAWTALATRVRLSASWTDVGVPLAFGVVMRYNSSAGELRDEMVPAASHSYLSAFDFVAPVPSGVLADPWIQFGVQARDRSSGKLLGEAWCSSGYLTVREKGTADNATYLQLEYDKAFVANDFFGALQAAYTALNFVESAASVDTVLYFAAHVVDRERMANRCTRGGNMLLLRFLNHDTITSRLPQLTSSGRQAIFIIFSSIVNTSTVTPLCEPRNAVDRYMLLEGITAPWISWAITVATVPLAVNLLSRNNVQGMSESIRTTNANYSVSASWQEPVSLVGADCRVVLTTNHSKAKIALERVSIAAASFPNPLPRRDGLPMGAVGASPTVAYMAYVDGLPLDPAEIVGSSMVLPIDASTSDVVQCFRFVYKELSWTTRGLGTLRDGQYATCTGALPGEYVAAFQYPAPPTPPPTPVPPPTTAHQPTSTGSTPPPSASSATPAPPSPTLGDKRVAHRRAR